MGSGAPAAVDYLLPNTSMLLFIYFANISCGIVFFCLFALLFSPCLLNLCIYVHVSVSVKGTLTADWDQA